MTKAIETMEDYVLALKGKDWSYQFSDDHSAYARGRLEHEWIEDARQRLDPDYTVWNSIAHPCFHDGLSRWSA